MKTIQKLLVLQQIKVKEEEAYPDMCAGRDLDKNSFASANRD
jgi:hypothetical protein